MSGSYFSDRRTSADSGPKVIRFLLQSGAATQGDRAARPDATGVTARRIYGREDIGVPGVERAAPRLSASGRLIRCWPKKRADEWCSQHTRYSEHRQSHGLAVFSLSIQKWALYLRARWLDDLHSEVNSNGSQYHLPGLPPDPDALACFAFFQHRAGFFASVA
jgi:hypothetical protein